MHHNELECHAKKKKEFAIFKDKVTARALMIKIWQFLLYLLNCWSFCYKTWFDGTLSWARVSYEEIGLLCSISRSRQKCKMSMTIYPDAVFWIANTCTTKLGTVVHQHEPNCLRKILVCCLQDQGQSGGSCHQRWLFNIFSELLILSQLK